MKVLECKISYKSMNKYVSPGPSIKANYPVRKKKLFKSTHFLCFKAKYFLVKKRREKYLE